HPQKGTGPRTPPRHVPPPVAAQVHAHAASTFVFWHSTFDVRPSIPRAPHFGPLRPPILARPFSRGRRAHPPHHPRRPRPLRVLRRRVPPVRRPLVPPPGRPAHVAHRPAPG